MAFLEMIVLSIAVVMVIIVGRVLAMAATESDKPPCWLWLFFSSLCLVVLLLGALCFITVGVYIMQWVRLVIL